MKRILIALLIATMFTGLNTLAKDKKARKKSKPEVKKVQVTGKVSKKEAKNKKGKVRTLYILETETEKVRLPSPRKSKKRKKGVDGEEDKTIVLEEFVDKNVTVKAMGYEIQKKKGKRTIIKKIIEITPTEE